MARIVAAAPSSQLVAHMFRRDLLEYKEGDEIQREKEMRLSRRVAELIICNADYYAFRVVSWAATFLSDTESFRVAPLFEVRRDLMDPVI